MAKTIDIKTRSYFPTLGKNATWGDAWEQCQQLGYDISIYDKICEDDDKWPHDRVLLLSLVYTDGTNEALVRKFEFRGDERLTFVGTILGEFNEDMIYRLMINTLIKDKLIKKPRNSKNIIESKASELDDLIKQRMRITMKINAWKKRGKDTTILENEKAELVKQIKTLR